MLDPKAIEQMIQDQVTVMVTDQVMQVFASDDWLIPLEKKIVQYTQDRILSKFSNATAMPEIVNAVKEGIKELFASGAIPNLNTYIDPESITFTVDQSIKRIVEENIAELSKDPQWITRVEQLINQAVTHSAMIAVGNIDITSMVKDRVDDNMELFREQLRTDFSSTGLSDLATENRITIMDDATVIENTLMVKQLEVADTTITRDLVVTGTVNTDNPSWAGLVSEISDKILKSTSESWREELVQQVSAYISEKGINFSQVMLDGEYLINGDRLASSITKTNIQTLGVLEKLRVAGEARINETLHVVNKRVGVNTEAPEMALSVWDEEVAVIAGKQKLNQAYIGTSRKHGLAIGTNRTPCIEITDEGLTQIKKLQVGVHRIGHEPIVPGWSGTRGDIVFNSNPGDDRVFAWVCLGSFKWQPLKSAE
jgi:hypothetical protein